MTSGQSTGWPTGGGKRAADQGLALAYYERFPEEIDRAIAANRRSAARRVSVHRGQPGGHLARLGPFLDAHISGPRIARALRERGYDVRAADEERQLDGLEDEQLLERAVEESRVMLTFDAEDFTVLARRWAEAGRSHAGMGIVVGIDHSEFGTIVDALPHELNARPEQSQWVDPTLFIARTAHDT